MAPKKSAKGEPKTQVTIGKSSKLPPPPRTVSHEAPLSLKAVVNAVLLLLIAAAYSTVSQLNLSPVYGSIPSSLYHRYFALGAIPMGWVLKDTPVRFYVHKGIIQWLPVLAFWIPCLQFYLFGYSDQLGPVVGPLVTEGLTFFPLASLSAYAAGKLTETERMRGNAAPNLVSFVIFRSAWTVAQSQITRRIGSSIVFTRSGLQFLFAVFYAILIPSKMLFFAIPAISHMFSFNVHFHMPHTSALLDQTLLDSNFSLLARQESLTGYISVLENRETGYRAMRCDHSLLGGEWLKPAEYEGRVAEPIYSCFVMLEAIRLVQGAEELANAIESSTAVLDRDARALAIGLGVGTLPSALIAHGIDTTIVEIDPAVHKLASQYFALPANHTPIIEDARKYIAFTAGHNPRQFDYIVHDVFTGGAEPSELFTNEFMVGLRDLLKDDGVVAIVSNDRRTPPCNLVLT
jgi:hypothetical protein